MTKICSLTDSGQSSPRKPNQIEQERSSERQFDRVIPVGSKLTQVSKNRLKGHNCVLHNSARGEVIVMCSLSSVSYTVDRFIDSCS